MLAKWSNYYASAPPWDSTRPASQLVAYLADCPAHREAAAPTAQVELPPQAVRPVHSAAPPVVLHRCSACESLRPPPSGAAVLELGCGTGASLCFLAQALGPQVRVVGVDLVPAAVTAARVAATQAGVAERAAFVQGDVFDLPLGFDYAMARRMASDASAGQQTPQLQHAGAADGGSSCSQPHPAPSPAGASTSGDSGGPAVHTHGTARGGADGSHGSSAAAGPGNFDLVYDCQFAHTLLLGERGADLVALLARLLKPGGLLFMLTGHAGEPEVGPAVLSEGQLRAAFSAAGGWEWVWLVPTRFDPTPHYVEVLGKRPLAWWALLRRIEPH